MKGRTSDAAGLLRIVAGVVLLIGMIAAIVLILLGAMTIVSGNNSLAGILRTTGVLLIVYGFIVAIWHTILYALLNGFSVIVENSDRTLMENALFEIADMQRNYNSKDGQV